MDDNPQTIRTARLSLRPLLASDAEVLYRIYQTEGVLRYFPNPTPPALVKVQRFITVQQAHWACYGYGNWGVLPYGEEHLIGWAGLQFLPEINATEVGFLLDRPFWGKGYATEAVAASLQFGFAYAHLDYIIALVHPENLSSRHVIEKCGMEYHESIRLWGMDLFRYQVAAHRPVDS